MAMAVSAPERGIHLDPERRHDLVFLIDVHDGNINGDPDAGNLPRVDPETMHGLVTDVSIKRRVRNYVDVARGDEDCNNKIYVQQKGIALNELHQRAYTALGKKSTGSKQDRQTVEAARAWMCANFWDVRMFGAVMTTEVNAGQVRGPVQFTFARSVDPIVPLEATITRVAVTKVEQANIVEGEDGKGKGKVTEMGRKAFIPYGLFVGYGYFTPAYARSTGATAEDLELLYESLIMGWELDRSASRGRIACRGLYVFTHERPLGNAPAHLLQERLQVVRRSEVTVPRRFGDYDVTVNEENVPLGITITRLIG